MRCPARAPLAKGETRERDGDLDPQIVWNGAKIRLTQEQVRSSRETGEVEIGDAQLVWRGKDSQDWSDLVVNAPPIYIQEKIHPKAIIDDLKRRVRARARSADRRARPLCRFQRARRPGGAGRVLSAPACTGRTASSSATACR